MEYVGIDLHKKESQICLLTETGEVIERRIRTEPQRFAEVLGGRPRARILVEASTESEWVARCLEALGASTSTRTSAASTPVRHAENTRASITRPGHPTCGSLKREDPTGPLPAQAPRHTNGSSCGVRGQDVQPSRSKACLRCRTPVTPPASSSVTPTTSKRQARSPRRRAPR